MRSCLDQSLPGGPKGALWNVDGRLKCVLSVTKSSNGHDGIFDIISESENDDLSGKTIHWRIDHPNVSQASTRYPQVIFNQGDKIKVDAGGCVRTNGGQMGQRWKQYVNPSINPQQETSGVSVPPNIWGAVYAGGLYIAAINSNIPPIRNEPFDVAISLQPSGGLTIPGSDSSTQPKHFDLSLLYYDNTFSDNGYYSHDNGTNDQCVNDGPAWVGVTVVRPKTPIAYSHFGTGKNFDLAWRKDKSGVDDNGLPLNPLWSFQVENPGQVPDFQASCGPNHVLDRTSKHCTSQATSLDRNTDLGLETFGYCDASNSLLDGHINWRTVTYQGGLFFRAWSGLWPEDDDINFGLETDEQAGQTTNFEGPDTGIGLEFKNSEVTANYTTAFWKAFEENATSQGQLISVNGNNPKEFADGEYGVVTGLLGIDGVHGGYSELHTVFAMAIEVAWNGSAEDGEDETWAFFIRNEGNEGSCSSNSHFWKSDIGDSTYAIQLPWPEGATSVKVVTTPFSKVELSSPEQKYLGMHGVKPWTYLRFKLRTFTGTGIDGEISLHYEGAISKKTRMLSHHARVPEAKDADKDSEETELGVNWSALSSRITDPVVRKQFLSDVNEAYRTSPSSPVSGTVSSIDEKETTFTHNQNFGAWIEKPIVDIPQSNAEKPKIANAIKTLLTKYSSALNLPPRNPRATPK